MPQRLHQNSACQLPQRGKDVQHRPERRCVVSGEVWPKQDLVRFVVGPDGTVVPDVTGTLPGRGFWIAPRRDLVQRASRRNLFAKATRTSVCVPIDLPDQVERLLHRRCVDLIGLANRARQAVAGYQRVRTWLASGRAGLLLQASDAAEGGRARLRGLGVGVHQGLPVSRMLNAAELGGPFGRDACVHVAIAAGSFADRLVTELRRLERYGADVEERKASAQR